jgi:cytochrome c oxidase subunit II
MVVLMSSLCVRVLVLACLLTSGTVPGTAGSSNSRVREDVQVVEVTAERFSFTPSEVRTKAGTTLEFRLRSDDTGHGFRVLGTDLNIHIPKRGKGEHIVRFTPDKPGRYTFECSKLCGAGHSFMRGVIIVSE